MHKILAYASAGLVMIMMAIAPASAAPEIGKAAPEIIATDTNGNPFKLSDHKGKIVVLEWTNHECPFVVKHYGSGNMQAAQKKASEHGVAWVSIVSSAEGKQGFVTAEEANKVIAESGASPTVKLLDPSGEIGKTYDAKTTPHMFVIDMEGNLAYAGAIDDNASPNPATIEGAKNYVLAAIDDLKAGKAVETAQSAPYGCSVKY